MAKDATPTDTRALICGLSGPRITDTEREFIRTVRPWGFIVFARNVDDPDQLRALTSDLRALSAHRDVPILVDQEGGRVQRLRPPHWMNYPTARSLGDLYGRDPEAGLRATWLLSRLHADDLTGVGLDVDCLPVLDVPDPRGHDVIGDRAYGVDVDMVAALGRAACDGLLAGGVRPVLKHIPGHGRAMADSHHDLPVVDASLEELTRTDFAPFKALNDVPMAMTAHVIYSAIDPHLPATTSPTIMQDIVRGSIGYDGLIMCDDITMGALSGTLTQRTTAMIAADCDVVLHCTGKMEEMVEVADATPMLAGNALRRAEAAMAPLMVDSQTDINALREEFAALTVGSQATAALDPTNYGPTA